MKHKPSELITQIRKSHPMYLEQISSGHEDVASGMVFLPDGMAYEIFFDHLDGNETRLVFTNLYDNNDDPNPMDEIIVTSETYPYDKDEDDEHDV